MKLKRISNNQCLSDTYENTKKNLVETNDKYTVEFHNKIKGEIKTLGRIQA